MKDTAKEREIVENITKAFVDRGQLVEAGWQALVIVLELASAPDIQRSEMRLAYFAGAQHLFGSIMAITEDGDEPTEQDMERLNLIDKELKQWIEEFQERITKQRRQN